MVLVSYSEHVLAHVKPGAGLEMEKAPQRAGSPRTSSFLGIEDQIDPYMLLVSIQRPVIKAEMMGWCS